ncbi:MAG: hypothetical protein WCJ02_02335 [bacterium]
MGRKEIMYSPNPLGSHAKHLQGGVALLFLVALLFAGIGCGIYLLSHYISSALLQKRQQKRLADLRQQAEQRRRIRKARSLNPPPSPEELLAQWHKTHGSVEEMLRFGAMLLDLEPVVDNGLVIDHEDGSGRIRGRKPGIKGWLADHCPQIGYKTAMRYKSIAQKAREIAGLDAPIPAMWALSSESVHNPQRESRVKMASNADCSLAKAQKKLAHVLQGCGCVQHVQSTLSRQLGARTYVLAHPRKSRRMGRFTQPARVHPKAHLFRLRSQTHKLFAAIPLREQKSFIEELASLSHSLKENDGHGHPGNNSPTRPARRTRSL